MAELHVRRLAALGGNLALLVELFATANLAFLALDVFLAHLANAYRNPAEWLPVALAALGALAMGASVAIRQPIAAGARRAIGFAVGWTMIAVGVAGLVWHLTSGFFHTLTLRDLVYSAPFAAPLAFTGVGLLLVLNRMVPADRAEWGRWVLVLAWGGFAGDFALTLLDHAQNGFFYRAEWVAVATSALAVAYFAIAVLLPVSRAYLLGGFAVLALQVAIGILGWILHIRPLLGGERGALFTRAVHGAPVFAPLLFVNLALLAAIGLAGMLRVSEPPRSAVSD